MLKGVKGEHDLVYVDNLHIMLLSLLYLTDYSVEPFSVGLNFEANVSLASLDDLIFDACSTVNLCYS